MKLHTTAADKCVFFRSPWFPPWKQKPSDGPWGYGNLSCLPATSSLPRYTHTLSVSKTFHSVLFILVSLFISSNMLHLASICFHQALSYRWFINEFPNFIQPEAGRWFVSQVTGNLYLANARANDTGNYFCFTTINMDISTKSIFSKAVQLTVYPDG